MSGLPTDNPGTGRMDVVVVGHVDHGKSTLIGRLLADTGSLPEGKLDQVRAMCERNARPFEYAFLLDALKNERSQGITIDTARCFFHTPKRSYVIHDAPGHIEFLKNMVTGATRAQAAMLLIDVDEGIRENSKRHGYILSMLGIGQVAVLVNKMDISGYDQERFEAVKAEYSAFLTEVGVRASAFIPIAAREGANVATRSPLMPWYDGLTVIEQLDAFEPGLDETSLPFRMPVQDVYKFTADGDDRRIFAGTVETGSVSPGDEIEFLPSGKRTRIATIERFNKGPVAAACAGQATGFTVDTQVYVKPGELAVRVDEPPARTAKRFRANLFWLGRTPMTCGARYKLKMGAARIPMELVEVLSVLDASDLSSVGSKQQLDRNDVGECVLESLRAVAYDLAEDIATTSRFVVVDGWDIAGFGIVLEERPGEDTLLARRVRRREESWARGDVLPEDRRARNGHAGKTIVFVGTSEDGAPVLARALERDLFGDGTQAYFLGLSEVFDDLDPSTAAGAVEREQHLRQLGDTARILSDAGLLFITTLADVTEDEMETLSVLNAPNELIVIRVGEAVDVGTQAHLSLPASPPVDGALSEIRQRLGDLGVLQDYSI